MLTEEEEIAFPPAQLRAIAGGQVQRAVDEVIRRLAAVAEFGQFLLVVYFQFVVWGREQEIDAAQLLTVEGVGRRHIDVEKQKAINDGADGERENDQPGDGAEFADRDLHLPPVDPLRGFFPGPNQQMRQAEIAAHQAQRTGQPKQSHQQSAPDGMFFRGNDQRTDHRRRDNAQSQVEPRGDFTQEVIVGRENRRRQVECQHPHGEQQTPGGKALVPFADRFPHGAVAGKILHDAQADHRDGHDRKHPHREPVKSDVEFERHRLLDGVPLEPGGKARQQHDERKEDQQVDQDAVRRLPDRGK